MTKHEFAHAVECEGWEYVLSSVSPGSLEDAGLAEALLDAQEAFKILVDATPEANIAFLAEEDQVELDFD